MSTLTEDVAAFCALPPTAARALAATLEHTARTQGNEQAATIWRGAAHVGAAPELAAKLLDIALVLSHEAPEAARFVGRLAADLTVTDADRARSQLVLAAHPQLRFTLQEIRDTVHLAHAAGGQPVDMLAADLLEFDAQFGQPMTARTHLLASLHGDVLSQPGLCARVVARTAVDAWWYNDLQLAKRTLQLCTQIAPAPGDAAESFLVAFATGVSQMLIDGGGADSLSVVTQAASAGEVPRELAVFARTALALLRALPGTEIATDSSPLTPHGATRFSDLTLRIAAAWRGDPQQIPDTHSSGPAVERTHEALEAALAAIKAANTGDAEACREYSARGIELGVRDHSVWAASLSLAALGRLELTTGSPDVAFTVLLRVADDADACGHAITAHLTAPDLCDAALRTGRIDVAQAALERLDAWEQAGCVWSGAAVARLRAMLAEPATADLRYTHALELAQGLGGSEARTRLSYGEYLRRTRRRVQARDELQAACELFHSVGHTAWERRARRELDATAHTAQRASLGAVRLTQRELQIAELVAAGASNQATADQLIMSRKTVEHHLRNIYQRFGIRSRKELAPALRANGDRFGV